MNYKVYQGDELKQTVTDKIAVMNGLQPNKTYDFSVEPDNTQTVGGRTRYTHTAWSWSIDGKDRFTNVYPSENVFTWDTARDFVSNGITGVFDKKTGILSVSGTTVAYGDIWGERSGDKDWNAPGSYTYSMEIIEGVFPKGIRLQTAVYKNGAWSANYVSELGVPLLKFTSNDAYVRDLGMRADTAGIVVDFKAKVKLEQGLYIGQYTDFTQSDSTNPSDYTWRPIQDGDATRDGTNETIYVTTRGIRFNVPKTLTVDSTITLRYEEYPLGIVPIGNEPSGMFGGGNKQNLSAKVISTANGSSVVEVAGNVIEVGGYNLLPSPHQDTVIDDTANTGTNGWAYYVFNFTQQPKIGDHITVSAEGTLTGKGDLSTYDVILYGSYKDYGGNRSDSKRLTAGKRSSATLEINNLNGTGDTILLIYAGNISDTEGKKNVIHHLKVEQGDTATPYASFVDGDTFTAQPDGTCALFSEHKAIYY